MNAKLSPISPALRVSRRQLLAAAAATSATFTWGRPVLAERAASFLHDVSRDVAGPVDIGGRSLYLECLGLGSPTVIFEAGYRSPATVWTEDLLQPKSPRRMVVPALAAETRVCAYERPGVAAILDDQLHPSRSDSVPMPRAAEDVVADLHALLTASGEPGPYVLVGHSLGGLMVRLYAATYPDDVAGLVLVDAWYEGLETLLTPSEWASYVALNSASSPAFAEYPDLETIDFADASATMRQAAAKSPLPPMPLIVLSKGQPFGISAGDLGFDPAVLESTWIAAQQKLSELLPDARHVIVGDSGHYIQVEQPDVVIDAVRQVIAGVRDPGTWTSAATQDDVAPARRPVWE